jgi:hypothetical protein
MMRDTRRIVANRVPVFYFLLFNFYFLHRIPLSQRHSTFVI